MVHSSSALVAAAATILLSTPVNAGMYLKSSPVLQVDGKSFDSLIARSNHTSIVEFYAPWCGHCQNLKPAYEKAAKSLQGLAKVAAVDCDQDANKPLCGSMGVKGFPTLKIFKPSKKAGKPMIEDYQGARAAKAIVEAVVEKIPNHVQRVNDKTLDDWLKESNETAKAVLFSDKGAPSALLKALAIDFLSSINVAQIRKTEAKAVETFGITKYPTLVLLPGGDKDGIVYSGELKKEAMSEFLSQIAPPNPDPAPAKAKAKASPKKKKEEKKASKDSSSFSKASSSHKSADQQSAKTSAASETIEEAEVPTESPNPVDSDTPPPVVVQEIPTIPSLDTADALEKACLQPKSSTCILAFLPSPSTEDTLLPEPAQEAIRSLSEIRHKHVSGKSHIFPFYTVPASNELAAKLREGLGLDQDKQTLLVAINAKRGWFGAFKGASVFRFPKTDIEGWVDAIRMGELVKTKLPEGIVKVEEEKHDEL